MTTRKLMLNIHLILAAFFMPMLLLMPFTGASYILGFKGDETKSVAFQIQEAVPEETQAQEKFFREQFNKNNVDFDFEYIRTTKTDFLFRPTTRIHYVASKNDDGSLTVSKVEPTIMKRMIELHKGHGPVLMRWFEVALGVALILTTLSGLWLAWTVPAYRKTTLISFGVGAALILICLL